MLTFSSIAPFLSVTQITAVVVPHLGDNTVRSITANEREGVLQMNLESGGNEYVSAVE